jgi:hypothetical protein
MVVISNKIKLLWDRCSLLHNGHHCKLMNHARPRRDASNSSCLRQATAQRCALATSTPSCALFVSTLSLVHTFKVPSTFLQWFHDYKVMVLKPFTRLFALLLLFSPRKNLVVELPENDTTLSGNSQTQLE